jgi:hypothetical protein
MNLGAGRAKSGTLRGVGIVQGDWTAEQVLLRFITMAQGLKLDCA